MIDLIVFSRSLYYIIFSRVNRKFLISVSVTDVIQTEDAACSTDETDER